MCKLLGIARSLLYYNKKQKVYNTELENQVIKIFRDSKNNYGSRKIKAKLHQSGVTVSRRDIRRIMEKYGLVSNYSVRQYKINHSKCNEDNINELSDEQLKSIGTSNAKVTYIKEITDAILSGKLDLSTLEYMDDVTVTKQLTHLKGIGNWTAKMYLIFILDRQDVLPFEDAAFLQGYAWAYKTTDFPVIH